MESLGGPSTPAVGWAAGIERLAMLMVDSNKSEFGTFRPDFTVFAEIAGYEELAIRIAQRLRGMGYSTNHVSGGSPKNRYRRAFSSDQANLGIWVSDNGAGNPIIRSRCIAKLPTIRPDPARIIGALETIAPVDAGFEDGLRVWRTWYENQ